MAARKRSYMGQGLVYGKLTSPDQGDTREADRGEFPTRSINSHRSSTARFERGPEGNEGCTVPANPYGPPGAHGRKGRY